MLGGDAKFALLTRYLILHQSTGAVHLFRFGHHKEDDDQPFYPEIPKQRIFKDYANTHKEFEQLQTAKLQ